MSDRIQSSDIESRLPKPEVKIIVSGESVYKPGMRTFLADDDVTSGIIFEGSTGHTQDEPVRASDNFTPDQYERARSDAPRDSDGRRVTRYTVCTCNTVLIGSIRTLYPGENPTPSPSPSPTPKPTAKPRTTCTCNKVKTCDCNSYKAPKKCTCNSQKSSRCSCNKVCSCVPVH